MNKKDIIKKLNRLYLFELSLGASLVAIFFLAISLTIKSPFSQWGYLLIGTIGIKYLFDSYITHIDKIRKIKSIK